MKTLEQEDIEILREALNSGKKHVGVRDQNEERTPLPTSFVGGGSSPVYAAAAWDAVDILTKKHVVFLLTRTANSKRLLVEVGSGGVTIQDETGNPLSISSREFARVGLGCIFNPQGSTKLRKEDFVLEAVVIDPTFGWYAKRGLAKLLFAAPTPNTMCTRKVVLAGVTTYLPDYANVVVEAVHTSRENA